MDAEDPRVVGLLERAHEARTRDPQPADPVGELIDAVRDLILSWQHPSGRYVVGQPGIAEDMAVAIIDLVWEWP